MSATATDAGAMPVPYDILVIGGGVNGTGIARDAAGRGYRVLLAEMADLASGTSSKATKLVHGGLRYLEHYEFRLVAESLAEREVLWAAAPHIVWPLRFVLPHHKGLRPAWVLRAGLFMYDHLGGRKLLPATKSLDLRRDIAGAPLAAGYTTGFEYSDCWVDDARLVALNARDAADRGASIRTRCKVVAATRVDEFWQVTLADQRSGASETVSARFLVNAAGPWVDKVIQLALGETEKRHVRLVKGSHLVVKKLYDHDRCYIFQNADNRIIFAIPYEDDFTLIGTTDEDFTGDLADLDIGAAETDYLLAASSEYFKRPVTRDDIVWSYAGVRPLFDDGATAAQEATRDYVLKLGSDGVLNVFGGKLTTYRRLSEEAVDKLAGALGPKGPRWTKTARLPGGDFPTTGYEALVADFARRYPFLAVPLVRRLVRHYGTRTEHIVGTARSFSDLGEVFLADLTAREVDYLVAEEFAVSADDVLWRRSKLGLRASSEQQRRLAEYLGQHALAGTAP